MVKKKEKTIYVSENRLLRWNYCQFLSQIVYRGKMTEMEMHLLIQEVTKNACGVIFKKIK
jgi:hypothetical protein